MIEGFEPKQKYNIDDLAEIIRILREPGGCPWDAEQTHQSIKKNLIEETYEVIEAINKNDSDLLCEELGDLLMQWFSTQEWNKKPVLSILTMSPTVYVKNWWNAIRMCSVVRMSAECPRS
jgi:NTP pyrophosphatase (non-canonical NTP hydrolase)